MIKQMIPHWIKVHIQLLKRKIQDRRTGQYTQYATKKEALHTLSEIISIEQALKPNDAKVQNLLTAMKRIESVQIEPNEFFSFWNIVGNPSERNGFVKSRSLVNGEVKATVGGGLCQLSGLIYYMSLHAKLEIVERHNHSLDIYTDETRFTPLGSDATVAYGYKDLQIRNTLESPIQFTFSVTEESITVRLKHDDSIETNTVEFRQKVAEKDRVEVTTLINRSPITTSKYTKLLPAE